MLPDANSDLRRDDEDCYESQRQTEMIHKRPTHHSPKDSVQGFSKSGMVCQRNTVSLPPGDLIADAIMHVESEELGNPDMIRPKILFMTRTHGRSTRNVVDAWDTETTVNGEGS